MTAATYSRYGAPEVVELRETAKPAPKDDEVLISVRAASVNPLDWHFMRGTPYAIRLMLGIPRPRNIRLGVDVAGYVEAAGRNVTRFQAGDEVFGSARGSFAEYVCTPAMAVVPKPACLTFEEAAAVPVAAITALQGLRDKGRLQAEHKVLINGASGGVGTFAVGIAKAFGAEVTAVCSTRNLELVRALGADRTIDYTKGDFVQAGDRYDVVLDCFASRSMWTCGMALKPGGTYIVAGGPSGRWMLGALARTITSPLLSWIARRKFVGFLARLNQQDLTALHDLIEAGKLRPAIDRRYPLSEIREALAYVETGHARGKVVISICPE